jgi:hypothetical protein
MYSYWTYILASKPHGTLYVGVTNNLIGRIEQHRAAVRNNNGKWFREFSNARKAIEKVLVDRKSVINQGLANINSRQRIDRVANLMRELVKNMGDGKKVSDQHLLGFLGLSGRMGSLRIIDAPQGFSDDTRSAIFLQDALQSAQRCKICGGYLDAAKAISYDHVKPVREGGKGTRSNGQLSHPFCNTGMKA